MGRIKTVMGHVANKLVLGAVEFQCRVEVTVRDRQIAHPRRQRQGDGMQKKCRAPGRQGGGDGESR
jgi:hypothetical protein